MFFLLYIGLGAAVGVVAAVFVPGLHWAEAASTRFQVAINGMCGGCCWLAR